jgi:hypothetical protein
MCFDIGNRTRRKALWMRQISECLPAWLIAAMNEGTPHQTRLESKGGGARAQAGREPTRNEGGDWPLEAQEWQWSQPPGACMVRPLRMENGASAKPAPSVDREDKTISEDSTPTVACRVTGKDMITASPDEVPPPRAVVISLLEWKLVHSSNPPLKSSSSRAARMRAHAKKPISPPTANATYSQSQIIETTYSRRGE